MDSRGVAIIGFVLIISVSVFLVPTILSATENPQSLDTDLEVGGVIEPTDGLRVTLSESSNSEATVELEDIETRQNTTLVIPEGNTTSYSLPGGNGTVENIDSTNQRAEILIEYNPTYSWSPAAVFIVDNLTLILVMVIVVVAAHAITVF